MELHNPQAEVFVPDGVEPEKALRRTTHLGIAAHPDDLEIMAFHGIQAARAEERGCFTGIVLADGRGGPRNELTRTLSADELHLLRRQEQRAAARLGQYGAVVFLDYPSAALRDRTSPGVAGDLDSLLGQMSPAIVYTHNLADKHDTHVAVALCALAALRRLPAARRTLRLLGCEVWRDLDWLDDREKVRLEIGEPALLLGALIGCFPSQSAGLRRYDLGTAGRLRANSTFGDPHRIGVASAVSHAMDLTPMLSNPQGDVLEFIQDHIRRFERDVIERLRRMGP